MANGFVVDVPGAVERGLQFRQQEQLRPIQLGQAKQATQFNVLKEQALKQDIQARTDEQKNIDFVTSALRIKALPDNQKLQALISNRDRIVAAGGDPTETNAGIQLAEQGRFDELNQELSNIEQLGIQQGIIKAPVTAKDTTLETATLEQRKSEQEFREQQAKVKAGELSATVQGILDKSQTEAIDAGQRSRSLTVLADDVNKLDIGGGLESTTSESIKKLLGSQDDVSELRRRFNAIRASQSVQNLPPGPASDKDIQLALSGFPAENAGGQQITAFLRGAAKLENINAAFQTFKSDLISETKSTKGLLKKWKSKVTSEVLGRDVEMSELFITAQQEGISIDDLKEQLGVK